MKRFPLEAVVAVFLAFIPTDGRGQTGPAITQQPVSQTVVAGSNVSFGVSVSGTGPFTYQWQFNEVNLPGYYIITTVAGNGQLAYAGDGGPATNASLAYPNGLKVDAYGNIFIADSYNNRVREVSTNGTIALVAGSGSGFAGDGGLATNALLQLPFGVDVDASGDVLIADSLNNRVREVTLDGIIRTIAGGGSAGNGSPATNAGLNLPSGLALDALGNLFIADQNDNAVREVGTNGIITLVAGNNTWGYYGDGVMATNTSLFWPVKVTADAFGNVFIADYGNDRIRKVDALGIISTVAGNGTSGYSGDGGPATNASLNGPYGLAVDASGNLFFADVNNQVIRKINPNGIITTVAGNGIGGYSGDGVAATNTSLHYPSDVSLDAFANLFITDEYNQRVRKLSLYGTAPILSLSNITSGDAGSYQVIISNAFGSVTSSAAVLTLAGAPAIIVQPQGLPFDGGQAAVFAVSAGGAAPLDYQWLFDGAPVTGATNSALILASMTATNTGSYSVIVSNALGSITSSVAVLSGQSPSIAVQPQSLAVADGQSALFTVTAAGSLPLAYQWFFNGMAMTDSGRVSGAQTSALLISNFLSSDEGTYQVTVSNAFGSTTSSVATLSLGLPPTITSQPSSVAVPPGLPPLFFINFIVSASGTMPLSYQWLLNGGDLVNSANVSGAQAYGLTIIDPYTYLGNYQVIVSNAFGSVTSSVATLSLASPAMITGQPTNLTVPPASDACFSVNASGTMPLYYQWLFDGTNITNNANISGAQSASLALNNVLSSDQGSYQVVVTNAYGSVTSSVATLSLVQPLLHLLGFSGPAGTLNLSATGGTPGGTCRLLTSTDPSLPLSEWTSVNNGVFDSSGNLSIAAAYNAGDSARFYVIVSP